MKPPRGLSAEEAEAWARVAETVRPLVAAKQLANRPAAPTRSPVPATRPPAPLDLESALAGARAAARARPSKGPAVAVSVAGANSAALPGNLDSHWDRRFRAGSIAPDFTLDLHGHTLDQAHARLDDGLSQAKAMGARVVLVTAGKPRPAEAADRGSRRGAIRAKLLDWLAAGPHGADVSAVRNAHRRHGGEGALYIVLKRPR